MRQEKQCFVTVWSTTVYERQWILVFNWPWTENCEVWAQQKTECESLHTLGALAAPTRSCWTWGEQTNISSPEENSWGTMEGSVLTAVSKYLRGAISAPRLLLRESDRQLAQRHKYTPISCYKLLFSEGTYCYTVAE